MGYQFDSDLSQYHIRARDYRPELSSWLSEEPRGLLFNLGDSPINEPLSPWFGLYNYARDNPMGWVDPDGLSVELAASVWLLEINNALQALAPYARLIGGGILAGGAVLSFGVYGGFSWLYETAQVGVYCEPRVVTEPKVGKKRGKKKDSCYCFCNLASGSTKEPMGRMTLSACLSFPYTNPRYTYCWCQ